jgi:formylglycine-generating enzyme required for sulfatase activity
MAPRREINQMSDDKIEQIESVRQAIATFEAQQVSSGKDLSALIRPLRNLLKQLEGNTAATLGSGSMAASGSISAGQDGAAIGRDVLGDVLVNSIKINFSVSHHASLEAQLKSYLNHILKECSFLRLSAIDQGAARADKKPLKLSSVYVDLKIDFSIPSAQSLSSFLKSKIKGGERFEPMEERKQLRFVDAVEALACHKTLALLGAPGSGKSTFMRYLALTLADAGLNNSAALSRLGKEWTLGPLVPVPVILRKFAARLPVGQEHGRAGDIWKYIDKELQDSGLAKETCSLLRTFADKAGALFLFDGLDEAGDERSRTRVLEAVSEFIGNAGEKSCFLITARPYAWENLSPEAIAAMPVCYKLAAFDSDQIQTFVKRWYEALSALGWIGSADAANKMQSLKKAVQQDDLRPLAQNPLLLTLMATLHTNRGRLPDDRVDLYDEIVKLLLQRWNESVGADRSLLEKLSIPSLTLGQIRDVIEGLAYNAHASHIGTTEEVADIPETAVLDALRPSLGGSWDKAALVVDYIEHRAGLLVGQGSRANMRQFVFPHRTFQEYLTGCFLARQPNFNDRAVELARESPDHWRLALVLAARQAGHERGVAVADALIHSRNPDEYRRLCRSQHEADWESAMLAGEQLLELGTAALESRDFSKAVRDRVASWLVALIRENALPANKRVRAAEILGRLGDPRFCADAWYLPNEPLLGFVEVPEGNFLMGTNKKDIRDLVRQYEYSKEWLEAETPQQTICLPRFYISRYPVTVAQFKIFIEDSGYGFKGSLQGLPNQPIVNVSWYDSLEYCSWLTKKLRSLKGIGKPLADLLHRKGWSISLPSEAQWEKAARGTDGRAYPWGNDPDADRANYYETGIGSVSTVGCFNTGASPYGCLDMVGNAWEWCQSKYQPYPYRADYGRESLDMDERRVVRGGCFGNGQGLARCAGRLSGRPDRRNNHVGFRVVVSPASGF